MHPGHGNFGPSGAHLGFATHCPRKAHTCCGVGGVLLSMFPLAQALGSILGFSYPGSLTRHNPRQCPVGLMERPLQMGRSGTKDPNLQTGGNRKNPDDGYRRAPRCARTVSSRTARHEKHIRCKRKTARRDARKPRGRLQPTCEWRTVVNQRWYRNRRPLSSRTLAQREESPLSVKWVFNGVLGNTRRRWPE